MSFFSSKAKNIAEREGIIDVYCYVLSSPIMIILTKTAFATASPWSPYEAF